MTNAPDLGDALLRPKIIEDLADDGFGVIRRQNGPAVEIAFVHDGTPEGVHQAEAIARLITVTPQLRDLLSEAIHVWAAAFDAPPDVEGCVSGADLVDWFARWRLKAKAVHAALNLLPALHRVTQQLPAHSDRRRLPNGAGKHRRQ
jgi:hypothetical protein